MISLTALGASVLALWSRCVRRSSGRKHPVSRRQHILRVVVLFRCLYHWPDGSVVPHPVCLRHGNGARGHAVSTNIACAFIECAIERDYGLRVGPWREGGGELESVEDFVGWHAREWGLNKVSGALRAA